ncbi:MAG: hypothetical protein U9N34_07250, partial [Candidatus Cloacimonadota bacterium]|nr:hypothetical protein [Candidatus Cloacimonadota bacterium]
LSKNSVSEKVSQNIVETTTEASSSLKLNRFGIIFEIVSIEMFDSTVTINLELTSTKDDRNIRFILYDRNFYTRLFDDSGNEFKPNRMSIANNSTTREVNNDIVQNIKTPATLIFNNVNKDLNKISLFELGIYTDNYDMFRVKYRDLKIKKIN